MRDRIRTERTIGTHAAAERGGAAAGVRLRGAAVPALSLISSFILLFVLILAASAAPAATPAGTIIYNTANATYTPGSGTPMTVSSPTVSVTTIVLRTTSVIEFMQYGAGAPGAQLVSVGSTSYSTSGTTAGPFAALPPPTHILPGAGPVLIDLSSPVPLVPAAQYHIGEPVFIRLTDGDQNLDPLVRETVLVTIQNPVTLDTEVLRLLETGPDTGVFSGAIQTGSAPAVSGDGVLQVVAESNVIAAYTDVADVVDTRATGALVDPFGIVFDSVTGLPVNGAVVTMVDAATGLPATVYGDDGVSIFPSAVVSGGTATDSGGTVYTFSAGGYRFPFVVAPGSYRLAVTPPSAYRAPSQVPTAVLQTLPGAPFTIAEPGSRGEDFVVNAGPAIHIDIPVDPAGTGLWLVKTAGRQTAAVGDLVPYRLTVENSSGGILSGVVVTDRLPHGFRYRKGSARLNGASLADPAVSSDGRSLSFSIGNLDPLVSLRADIIYVAEAGAGARPGTAINTAVASGTPGAISNTAHASVEIIEDLYRGTATIVGRVIVDGCGDKERSEEGGLAGVRIFREDGTFVVTDKNGMYHFAAVKPGTHVVQLDLATLPAKYEVLACEENTRFAGTAFSQFVDLQGGALWRADFHLGLRPKQIGEVGIEIMTAPKGLVKPAPAAGRGRDLVEFSVLVHVGIVPARNLKLTIMLPEGGVYQPGSASFSGGAKQPDGTVSAPTGSIPAAIAISEPQIADGSVTFRFGELPANSEGTLRFDVAVQLSGAEGQQLTTGAMLTSDSPDSRNNRTPVVNSTLVIGTRDELRPAPDIVLHPRFSSGSADLTAKDKAELDRMIIRLNKSRVEHITVTGHTDSQPIRPRARSRFPDNYALSHERAAVIGAYLADGLGLTHDQVTYEGMGPDEPVASNATEQGRSQNRRVELRIKPAMEVVAVPALKGGQPSGMKAVAVVGLRPGEVWPQEKPAAAAATAARTMPEYDAAWLAAAAPGAEWLWPPEGHQPPIAAVKIAAKHDPALLPRLVLNGEAVDAIYCDGMRKNADGTIGVSRWSGVHLLEGDNRFELVLTDAQGREVERLERSFHYSGAPVRAELVPGRSRLTADGRETAVLAVRFLDRDGKAAREGTLGEFTVDPPYLAQQRAAQLQQSPLAAPATDRIRYQVDQDGIALIELAPTTRSGEAVLRFPLRQGEQEIRAWLRPEARDWVLVGLAEGTYGYNVVTGNRESLGAAGGEDNFYHEGRVAFYAKGVIKGEWLLTAAYDSAKETDGKRSMYQSVDPNKYYTLYGDATEQLNDAPSAKHVYVKLERGQFYALFGDYTTGLTVTELTRYSRNLTGIKSEMKGDRFEYTVFAADTDQAHVKDELRGDGTSGLYRLSRRNIVINSETIAIEARDRFKSEVIVSTQRLTRNVDYTIDYEAGTVFFKSPVPSRDGSFDPVFIVAEYETFDGSNTSYTYGGRVAVNGPDKRVQAGVSHVHEGPRGADGEVTGVDATVQLTPETRLRAEVARSTRDQAGVTTEGTAYLAEVQHRSASLDGKVYVREQETGFGLGQQNGSETGTRKIGGEFLYRIDPRWSAGGEVFRQENLATEAVRDMAEVRARYTLPGYEVFAGLRHAEDTLGTGEAHRSEQFFAGAKYQFTERLTGRVQHDQTLSSTDSSVDFPTRTTVGMDYRLTRDTTLFADQELTKGSQADTSTSRIGVRSAPWTGAQLNSTMERQTTENGERLFATTGLKQAWQVTKRWSLDAGLDRSTTIHESGNYTLNTNVPPASGGTEDFTAVFLGAAYRADRWSWTGRIEDRRAETEDKVGVYAGANGEVNSGLALAAGLQTFRTVNIAGPVKFTGDLRLGAAYRPRETRVIVLDRFDYIQSEQKGVDLPYDNWRVVNNFVLNYKLDGRTQWSLQYGAKYVNETIEKNDYRGYTDLTGIEGRYDITRRWDVGLRVSMLRSLAVDQMDYGTQASVGLLAGKNLWISLGYNFAGYTDRDFSKADFTAEGPFVKIRMKFDQASVREAVKWITGQ